MTVDQSALPRDLVTGIAWMDRQHLSFVKAMDDLDRSMVHGGQRRQVFLAMGALYRHVVTHFADEEEWMVRIGYPAAEEHARAHDALCMRLAELEREVRLDSSQGRILLAHEIHDTLSAWFSDHLLTHDVAAVRWWREHGGGEDHPDT